jgi:hypothetical protein
MTQFTNLNHSCSVFSDQANSLIHAVRPTQATRGTSGLLKVAEHFLSGWVDFIDAFNAVVAQGLQPHFFLFSRILATLIEQLKEVAGLLEAGTLRSYISRAFFAKIQADATALKKEANMVHRLGKVAQKSGFDEKAFGARVNELGRNIAQIFEQSIPRCTMATSTLMRVRTMLSATSNELILIGNGTALFSDLAVHVRSHIATTSQLIDELCTELGLPVGVKLDFDGEDVVVDDDDGPAADAEFSSDEDAAD